MSPVPNPVFETSGEISEMRLLSSPSVLKFVNPDTEEMLAIELLPSFSVFKFVDPDTAEMSAMLLLTRSSVVRFVASSNPVRLLIDALRFTSEVNVFISVPVIAASAARFTPSVLLIARWRLASGMLTRASEVKETLSVCPAWVTVAVTALLPVPGVRVT